MTSSVGARPLMTIRNIRGTPLTLGANHVLAYYSIGLSRFCSLNNQLLYSLTLEHEVLDYPVEFSPLILLRVPSRGDLHEIFHCFRHNLIIDTFDSIIRSQPLLNIMSKNIME